MRNSEWIEKKKKKRLSNNKQRIRYYGEAFYKKMLNPLRKLFSSEGKMENLQTQLQHKHNDFISLRKSSEGWV